MFKITKRCYLMAWLGLRSLAPALLLAALTPGISRAEPSPSATQADADAGANANANAGVVNLNSASTEELVRLPGIGPARAAAILELRARLKRFTRVEELLRVKGIGRATFRKLRPLLSLDGPTTLRERG